MIEAILWGALMFVLSAVGSLIGAILGRIYCQKKERELRRLKAMEIAKDIAGQSSDYKKSLFSLADDIYFRSTKG